MTTTVGYYLPEFTQGTLGDDSGMKLKLSKPSDRSAVNGSGDALLWAGQGWLTAVVGETWTESLAASVEDASGLIPRAGWLGVGSTVVSDVRAELDSASLASVNAQVVDALSVDTYAELTAPPAATSSLKDKITWLFMYARNKVTQTASQRKLYRDDGSTVAGTSATSDDSTTFTKGEDA